jgi:uncharacterized protein (DUF697 family)
MVKRNKVTKSDMRKSFDEVFNKEKAEIKRPNILICGYTGTGKTTIAQVVFGKDVVSDDKINDGKPGTMDYLNYQNDFISLWDSQGFELGYKEEEFLDKTRKFIRERQDNPDIAHHIQLVWYCIQGPGARVTPYDIKLIKNIFNTQDVIVLITKNDITKPIQRESMEKELIKNGVKKDRILSVSENDEDFKNLIELSYQILPEAYRDAFISAQQVDLEKKKEKAGKIIHTAAIAAAAAGAIPIPFSDAIIITPIQLGMVAGLAINYGMPYKAIETMIGPVIAEELGVLTAGELTKLIPVIGSVIQATVAFALTEALGHIVKNYLIKCSEAKINNQPMPTFSFDKFQFKALYEKYKKAGKEYKGEYEG